MTFKLERQPPGRTLTKFFVYDADDSIVGTINVSNEAADDLLKHWRAAPPQASLKESRERHQ